jgi:signal transduction histidine kinase
MRRKNYQDTSDSAEIAAIPAVADKTDDALLSHMPVTNILEAMPDAVAIYDDAGLLVYANAVGHRLFGLERDAAFRTRPLRQRNLRLDMREVTGEPLPEERWHVTRLLQGETITGEQPAEMLFTSLDGVERTISVTGAPIASAEGTLLGAIAIARDITEQRQSERQQADLLRRELEARTASEHAARRLERRTQESLEALLEMAEAVVSTPTLTSEGDDGAPSVSASRVGHRLIELARQVLGCQRISLTMIDATTGVMRALAVTGLTPDEERLWWAEQAVVEARGVRLEDSPEPELVEQLLAGAPVTMDLREPRYQYIPNNYGIQTMLIAPMRIGQQLIGFISLDYAGQPHEFTAPELDLASAVAKLSALVIERDRMLRERAIAEAHALALTQANQRMDEFLGIAAHELRTPITVIKANLQMLLRYARRVADRARTGERVTIEPQRAVRNAELLDRTERSLSRLTRLVDDLLDVSRVRAGKLEMRLEPVDLADVARETVEEQRLATPDRLLSLDLPAGQRMPALADASRVGQVITNYLTNALKYSDATTPVRVRLWRDGALAYLSVTDKGVGIPADEIEQVWELFHRIPGIEVVSGSGIGLGLGLHLCKTIIERQGGRVGASSALGEGSTFWFSLPLLDTPAEP